MRLPFAILASMIVLGTIAQAQEVGCRHMKNKLRFAGEKAMNNADSVHVAHYNINVDTVSFSAQTLWSHTGITAVSLVDDLDIVRLDLQGHTVDSVIAADGSSLSFTHDGLGLDVSIPMINTGDTSAFTIYYHGQPSQDPSGWGGFYWSGSVYAFNLGVGFEEDPHVYGRAWYPCLDVFTDKSTYEFHVTVDSTYLPVCNGELTGQTDLGDGRKTTHWIMNDPIPSYLVAFAVAPFVLLEREYSGIPAQIACVASDSNNVNSTFVNMQSCVDLFLDKFGPYRFNRIGYSVVPFNGGAMEHATSIHIGKVFIDGSLTYETLWAHELAHMWWGDNVTCTTAEDMWLNEGWASYSEALFTEEVYGEEAYMNWFRPLHRQMLQFAHIEDGDYYAMNDIPHSATYGSHVYEKGPLMCHSLRGYMGDSLFFQACRAFQDSLEFGNASSVDMMNIFSSSSGLDMTGFFEGWILEPGWAHFSIDSFSVASESGSYDVEVHLRQRSRANQHLYDMKVPVYITDGSGNETTEWVSMNQETQSFNIEVDFEPALVMIDGEEQLADAMATYTRTIDSDGYKTFLHTNARLDVEEVGSEPSLIRIADNFVSPVPNFSEPGILLNQYHYWTVEGILADGLQASVEFKYFGTESNSSGYMDNELFVNNDEDSLIMLYRPGPGHSWQEPADYEVETGASSTNLRGDVVVNNVQLGEYVLAIRDAQLAMNVHAESELVIYPNPASSQITVRMENAGHATVKAVDSSGRVVFEGELISQESSIDCSEWPTGTYILNVTTDKGKLLTKKVEIR